MRITEAIGTVDH